METKELASEGLLKKYSINVTTEEFKTSFEENAQEIAKAAELPGFRPGKVPLSMIKARYAQRIQANVIEKLLDSGLNQILANNTGILILGSPILKPFDFKEGSPLVMELEFEIFPTFDIDYSTIQLTKHTADYTDDDIESIITRLQEFYSTLTPLKDAVAENGRILLTEIKMFSSDDKDKCLYEKQTYIKIGEPFVGISDFSNNLIGTKPGDNKEFTIECPADCTIKDCANKKVNCRVKIQEIYEQQRASTDEVALKFGFDSLEKFKESIKDFMPTYIDSMSKKLLRQSLIEGLKDRIKTVELPTKSLAKEIEHVKAYSNNNQPKSDEEIKTLAEKRLRLSLLLGSIINKEHIQATQKDVIALYNSSGRAQAHSLSDIPGPQQEELAREVVTEKALDLILTKVNVQENKISCDELFDLFRNTLSIPSS